MAWQVNGRVVGAPGGHADHALPRNPKLFWAGELLALLLAVVLVLLATQLLVSKMLVERQKQTQKAKKRLGRLKIRECSAGKRLAYPWRRLPEPWELMAVGPSFATNFQSGLKQSLAIRGLAPAEGLVLMSFLVPADKKKTRALLERVHHLPGPLGGKRALARHLRELRMESLAPMTFLQPHSLRKALEPQARL